MTLNNFPSLAGTERARLEDWNWATALFTWAVGELRKTETAITARPLNRRLRAAAADTADAITEKLEEWQPPHRAN
jgi:hypothetical protein